MLAQPGVIIRYCDTAEMAADIFTKHFANAKADIWLKARDMLGIKAKATTGS